MERFGLVFDYILYYLLTLFSALRLLEFSRSATANAVKVCAPGVPLPVIGQTIQYVAVAVGGHTAQYFRTQMIMMIQIKEEVFFTPFSVDFSIHLAFCCHSSHFCP